MHIIILKNSYVRCISSWNAIWSIKWNQVEIHVEIQNVLNENYNHMFL